MNREREGPVCQFLLALPWTALPDPDLSNFLMLYIQNTELLLHMRSLINNMGKGCDL